MGRYRQGIPLATFYLGTHHAGWLTQTDLPLFLSRRRLSGLKRLPRACGPWALDSGGFTELSTYGRWTVTARGYAAEVRRYAGEIGNLAWAAAADWMCEPWIVEGTGLSVGEHQRRTLDNYLELRAIAPDLPWVPVLQGWTLPEYLEHLDAYAAAGIDLAALSLVGVGSICRRQGTVGAAVILRTLAAHGLSLHAFGLKAQGLRRAAMYVTSADSMAWSLAARRCRPLPSCQGAHVRCNNCMTYALRWRERLMRSLDIDPPAGGSPPVQRRLLPGTLAA